MPRRLRIFVSSPGDVLEERLRASLVVDKLAQEYGRFFDIESYRWEYEPMLASGHFQDAIDPPSTFDIVVLVLWSRLGTSLPERTAKREYRGIDGRAPVTGTEWEYEEALTVARKSGAPDLLAFRNISPAPIDTRDADARAKANAQLDALDQFWRLHFADKGVFLAAYDEYRTLEEFAHHLEQSLRKLIEKRIKSAIAGEGAPLWLGEPFRGLESYEFKHAPIFFGRDAAIEKATEQLAANARAGHAFLLVSGPSGSGKSSLIKAGVVPRLMKPQRISGTAFLRRAVFRPGTEGGDIFLSLAQALTGTSDEGDIGLHELLARGQDAAQLARYLRAAAKEPGFLFANALGHVTDSERRSGRLLAFEEARLILVVDQLEELLTNGLIGPEDRFLFIRLVDALARSGVVWIIASLRADFWHRATDMPDLVALSEGQGRIDLPAPSQPELASMIRKPAEAAGLSFEVHPRTGLPLDAVLVEAAAAAPGALPLLSFTLDELYKSARARGDIVLTYESYEALNGLEGAITKRADEVLAGLPANAQAALPRVLRSLTTVTSGANQATVAKPERLDAFPAGSPSRQLIDAFVSARLLVAQSQDSSSATVQLAHEALISRWTRAREQLAADRRDLETRAIIERQFARWSQASGRARSLLLLRNPDLANASDLARRWGDDLSAPVRGFIQRSARRAQFANMLTAAAAVAFAAVAGVAVYAERQAVQDRALAETSANVAQQRAHEAEVQRNQALLTQSRFLVDLAHQQDRRGDHATAAALALEALPNPQAKVSRPYLSDAESALYGALMGLRERFVLKGHIGTIDALAFSPDGARLASLSNDKTVRIWNVSTGAQIALLRGIEQTVIGNVSALGFSADGRQLIAGSGNTVQIWDVERGNMLAVLKGHENSVTSAVLLPDGHTAITGGMDRTARLWDTTKATQIALLSSSIGWASEMCVRAISPDGQLALLAIGNEAYVWPLAEPSRKIQLVGHSGNSPGGYEAYIAGGKFSADGTRVITWSGDQTARLWDTATGAQLAILQSQGALAAVAFAGAQAIALSAAGDIWDVGQGKKIRHLAGNKDPLENAKFFAGGRLVLAQSQIDTRVWDVPTGRLIATLDTDAGEPGGFIGSPSGRFVATGHNDRSIRLWDLDAFRFLGDDQPIGLIRVSPNASRVLTTYEGGRAVLWDGHTGARVAELLGHIRNISGAWFSPDEQTVVTSAPDGTARAWDAMTGSLKAVLKGDTQKSSFTGFKFSQDGRLLLGENFGEQSIFIYDLKDYSVLMDLKVSEKWMYGSAGSSASFFSADNNLLIFNFGVGAVVWDRNKKQAALKLKTAKNIERILLSSDRRHLVTITRETVQLWEADSGTEISAFGHKGEGAMFSDDGALVLSGYSDGTYRLWNVGQKTPGCLFKAPQRIVMGAFLPGGRKVLTYSYDDRTARLWDIQTCRETGNVEVFNQLVPSATGTLLTLRPDGKTVLSLPTFADMTALIGYARQVLPRELTDKQRQDFFLSPAQ